MVFTIFAVFLFPGNDIFFYYNTAWFLWHLLFISLVVAFEEAYFFKRENRFGQVLPWMYVLLWLLFGGLQLVLMQIEGVVYWKFAKEISKFFGYLICFVFGRWMIRHKEIVMEKNKLYYISLIVFIVAHMLGVAFGLDPEVALVRISCGVLSSEVIVITYYNARKNAHFLEYEISKYSLEIYLIHVVILRLVNLDSPAKGNLMQQVCFVIIEFTAFLWIPLFVAHCEKYVLPLRRLFHPM